MCYNRYMFLAFAGMILEKELIRKFENYVPRIRRDSPGQPYKGIGTGSWIIVNFSYLSYKNIVYYECHLWNDSSWWQSVYTVFQKLVEYCFVSSAPPIHSYE